MKLLALSFCILVFLPATSKAQSRPIPPARRELQKYQSAHPDEPAQQVHTRIDPIELQHEAVELASLAQSIPPDIDKVTNGMLPKDVLEKLKRIEKLSKRLRGELAP